MTRLRLSKIAAGPEKAKQVYYGRMMTGIPP